MKHHNNLFKNGVLKLSRKISTVKSKHMSASMDHANELVDEQEQDENKDLNDNGERTTSNGVEDNVSVKIEEQNSSSSSEVQDDKGQLMVGGTPQPKFWMLDKYLPSGKGVPGYSIEDTKEAKKELAALPENVN